MTDIYEAANILERETGTTEAAIAYAENITAYPGPLTIFYHNVLQILMGRQRQKLNKILKKEV